MKTPRTLLLASAAVAALSATSALAEPASSPHLLLAQAETTDPIGEVLTDPVAIAEAAVEEARANLRAAMATGDGISEARQRLREAIAALEEVRASAGLPPSGETEEGTEPEQPAEQPPAPPAEEPPPPAEEPPPPPAEQPPAPVETPPPPPEEVPPPVIEEIQPPPVLEEVAPPVVEEVLPPAVQEAPPPPVDQPPPAVEPPPPPPAPEQPAPEAVQPPPAPEQPAPPPPPEQVAPPADQPAPAEAVPAVEPPPVIDLLPPPAEVEAAAPPPPPPPPPPPEGSFSLDAFTVQPDFGAQAPAAAAPPPPLPQAPEQVQEGAALRAGDGRVILKNQGQVTVIHDDTSRFRQQGDDVRRERTQNETETTTVRRPNGVEIVTVRDRWGNIVQRYRKNPNGSVDILIGDREDPGFFGGLFGQRAQPAPPPPRRPPAPLNFQLGPLQVTIPQQEYIVESSRADRRFLEQTLMAPPVEQVERAYTLEEIRRSGRIRDKVRRIDFDTITFNTGQATIPADQISQMQSIGYALRDIIQQDPTQVFLIEGHTDAVGSDLSNLALSDRRAETVAEILAYYFGIPPENLVTQGYGEQFLKIPTVAAERTNRRVAFRNISNLLAGG